MLHYKITVQGKVQGVYYRATAKQMADILNLKGFVQNTDNGNVYIEVEGEEGVLVKFVQWCHHGPDRAEVKHVSVTDGALQHFEHFEVKR